MECSGENTRSLVSTYYHRCRLFHPIWDAFALFASITYPSIHFSTSSPVCPPIQHFSTNLYTIPSCIKFPFNLQPFIYFFSSSCAFSQMSGHFAFHLFISIPPDHAFHYFHQSATVSWGHSFTIVLSKPSTLSLKTKVFKCKWKVNWTGYWRTWLQNSRLLTRQSNP